MSLKKGKKIQSEEPDLYVDPENVEDLISEIKELASSTDENKEAIQAFIMRIFPKWLIASTTAYCPDYPHFQRNWQYVCQQNNTTPKRIVIVDKIFFDLKDHVTHRLLMLICEILTRRGYAVRRKEEFVGCLKCGRAIPDRDIWLMLKKKGFQVPRVWSNVCATCKSNTKPC